MLSVGTLGIGTLLLKASLRAYQVLGISRLAKTLATVVRFYTDNLIVPHHSAIGPVLSAFRVLDLDKQGPGTIVHYRSRRLQCAQHVY